MTPPIEPYHFQERSMLDPIRTQALRAVIDSLPLTGRQRDLADETIASLLPEEADAMIRLHQDLVENLPAARAAIDHITGAPGAGQPNESASQTASTMTVPGRFLSIDASRPSTGPSQDKDI